MTARLLGLIAAASVLLGGPHVVGAQVGRCGGRFEQNDRTVIDDRVGSGIGHAFRGLGSPGHGTAIASELRIAGMGTPSVGYVDQAVSAETIFGNLSSGLLGRACATLGLDLDLVTGWAGYGGGEATGSRLGVRLGFLSRTASDDTRFHLEVEGVFPSADTNLGAPFSTRRIQAGINGGLARGVDEEIFTLSPLEWGLRGIGRLTFQFHAPGREADFSVWLDVRVAIGYARLTTLYGPREGLVGGPRLSILGGAPVGDGWSFRAGVRGAVGVGSLWPTDVVFPLQGSIVVELGHVETDVEADGSETGRGGSVITADAGVLFARLPVGLGDEMYFQFGIRYVGHFAWSLRDL